MLLAAALSPMHAYCEGWSFDHARPEWGKFALGVVSGVAGHELGHYLVATAKGYKVRHDGLSIVYPGAKFTPADELQVASAGFQAQARSATIALEIRRRLLAARRPG